VREQEAVGPVLFAYDGSRLAKAAIAEAGRQLPAGRDALVLTVWRTFNVGFIPEPGAQFDAACADSVGEAAEQTAARGATLAEEAGFRAQPLAVQGTPAAKAVTDAADDHDASLIVLGAHRKTGLGGRMAGSVAAEVASRSQRPVMIVHDGAGDEAALSVRLISVGRCFPVGRQPEPPVRRRNAGLGGVSAAIGNGDALLYGLPALDPSINAATLAAGLTKALAGPTGEAT
jgi:nucleotide-binding universal stress UspA family protein